MSRISKFVQNIKNISMAWHQLILCKYPTIALCNENSPNAQFLRLPIFDSMSLTCFVFHAAQHSTCQVFPLKLQISIYMAVFSTVYTITLAHCFLLARCVGNAGIAVYIYMQSKVGTFRNRKNIWQSLSTPHRTPWMYEEKEMYNLPLFGFFSEHTIDYFGCSYSHSLSFTPVFVVYLKSVNTYIRLFGD